jgi:hypothetical protein
LDKSPEKSFKTCSIFCLEYHKLTKTCIILFFFWLFFSIFSISSNEILSFNSRIIFFAVFAQIQGVKVKKSTSDFSNAV